MATDHYNALVHGLRRGGVASIGGITAGVACASGYPGAAAIFAGLIAGAAVVSSRKALLWFVIIGGLVVTGLAQLYLPGARYIRYLVPLASAGLLLHAIMDRFTSSAGETREADGGIAFWALMFLGIAAISTIVNFEGAGGAIMGLKGYFQMWLLLFGLILIRWPSATIASLPRGMLCIAFLQLPFVLHQLIYLVPMRARVGAAGLVPVDIVAGTFGGSLYGGGANAVLAAFLLMVVSCLLGLWKHGSLSRTKTIVLTMLFLAPLLVNEAKISAIYIPLIFLLLFYRDIIAKPLRFAVACGAMLALLATLLTALTLAQPSGKLHSWSDLVAFTFERETASISDRRGQYSELTRWTSLTFWWQEHVSSHPIHLLIGHGPGASRVQEGGADLVSSLAEKRYGGLKIGYTGLSALLWDTGILGLASMLGLFIVAFQTAGWLSRYYRKRDRFRAGLFDGLRAAIAVFTLSLAHKDFIAFHIPYQTLILLVFGYLAVSRNQIAKTTG